MNKGKYPDIIHSDGTIEEVTRIPLDFQRLASKRMTELVCGVPVKRVYHPENEGQRTAAKYIEAVYRRNRIDSVNVERLNMLYAGCEFVTLWYTVEQPTDVYGFNSRYKVRCRNFSPMLGDDLYPYFDEFGDLVALSVGYSRRSGRKNIKYFDVYTANRHIRYSTAAGAGWSVEVDEKISIGKIPGVYCFRPTPVWESTSDLVYEIEWALSRNGNYLRKNSKPLFVVFADEEIQYGEEEDEKKEFRSILQYPKGSSADYVTWPQATESLKFYVTELRNYYFTQLQLPDWSYEKMSQQALSGESRKQLFIDCQLKVKDESGRLLECFDREMNVVKAIVKDVAPDNLAKDIDELAVETEITPFTVTDEKDTINNLMAANGGLPLCSQRESIEYLGWSQDIDKTMQQIAADGERSVFEPYS